MRHPPRRGLDPLAGSRRRRLVSGLFRLAVGAIALVAMGALDEEPSVAFSEEQPFGQPSPYSNGRSCAACHVPEDSFTLTPDNVTRLLERGPIR